MRISYWGSDVCPSDLSFRPLSPRGRGVRGEGGGRGGQQHKTSLTLPRVARAPLSPEKGEGQVISPQLVHNLVGHIVIAPDSLDEIVRDACRERVCQYV